MTSRRRANSNSLEVTVGEGTRPISEKLTWSAGPKLVYANSPLKSIPSSDPKPSRTGYPVEASMSTSTWRNRLCGYRTSVKSRSEAKRT